MPAAEVAVGLLLASSLAPVPAALAATAMLLLFGAAMIAVLARGITTSCGCHGSLSSSEVRPALVVRNLVLVAIIGASTPTLTLTSPPPDPITQTLACAAAAFVAVVLAATDLIRATSRTDQEGNVCVITS